MAGGVYSVCRKCAARPGGGYLRAESASPRTDRAEMEQLISITQVIKQLKLPGLPVVDQQLVLQLALTLWLLQGTVIPRYFCPVFPSRGDN